MEVNEAEKNEMKNEIERQQEKRDDPKVQKAERNARITDTCKEKGRERDVGTETKKQNPDMHAKYSTVKNRSDCDCRISKRRHINKGMRQR